MAQPRARIFGRRGGKTRDQADQVAHQDKHANAANHRQVFPSAMPGGVFEQVPRANAHRIRQQRFHALLRAAGIVHRQPPLEPCEKDNRQLEKRPIPWRCDLGLGTRHFRNECAAPRAKPSAGFPSSALTSLCHTQNLALPFVQLTPGLSLMKLALNVCFRSQHASYEFPHITSIITAATTANSPPRTAATATRIAKE